MHITLVKEHASRGWRFAKPAQGRKPQKNLQTLGTGWAVMCCFGAFKVESLDDWFYVM